MTHRCALCNQPVFGAAEIFALPIVGNELEIVRLLLNGQIVDREKILDHIYGRYGIVEDRSNSFAQALRNLNKKITKIGFKVVTVYGIGNQLVRYSKVMSPI